MVNALLIGNSRSDSTSDHDEFMKKACSEVPIAHKVNIGSVFKNMRKSDLIKEICWILYGVEDSILFEYQNHVLESLTSFDDLIQGAFAEILKPIFRTGDFIRNILKLLSVYSNIEPHQAATHWLRVYVKDFWKNVDGIRRNHSHSVVDFIVNVRSLLDEIDVISVVFQPFFDQEIICRFNVKLFLHKLVSTLTTLERLGVRETHEKLFDLFCICISSLLRKLDQVLDGLLDKHDTSAALLEMLEILPNVEKSIFFSSLRSNIESILSMLKIFVHLSDYDGGHFYAGPKLLHEFSASVDLRRVKSLSLEIFSKLFSQKVDNFGSNFNSNLTNCVQDQFCIRDVLLEFKCIVTLFAMEPFYLSLNEYKNRNRSHLLFLREFENLFRFSMQNHFGKSLTIDRLFKFTLKLTMDSENFSKVNLETIVQNLEFDYEMQWPMNLIITPTHLNIYNKIFRFLMSICLEKLRLVDLNMKDLSNNCDDKMAAHSLMLTRFRLSNTVSSIFSFLLSQISLNVQIDDICGCKTFDEMCKKHDSTVRRLLTISFLDAAHDILHRAIVKMLDSSKHLALCWNRRETSYMQAQSIENEVDKCHKFLLYIVGKSQDSESKTLLSSYSLNGYMSFLLRSSKIDYLH